MVSARSFNMLSFFGLILTLPWSAFVEATTTTEFRASVGAGSSVWDKATGEELPYEEIARRFTRRTSSGGVHIPIVQTSRSGVEKRGNTAAIGLGDYVDVSYSVLLTIGETTTPLILDTGSSDLWVMSDRCTTGCGRNLPLYPLSGPSSTRTTTTTTSSTTSTTPVSQSSSAPGSSSSSNSTLPPVSTGFVRAEGLEARLFYGDSGSGTAAFGEIGRDIINLAGITMVDQYFAAINRTNTSISRTGSAGIFGLGFPTNSVIWSSLFQNDLGIQSDSLPRRSIEETNHRSRLGHFASRFPDLPFRTLPSFAPPSLKRQISSGMVALLSSFNAYAPFLPRLIVERGLASPLFTVTLQRNTLDVGGNLGQLTVGELPEGVEEADLTWVPVRNYSYAEKGLPAPPDSPRERYPIAWEVLIDDVYLDGVRLPRSNLSAEGIELSALFDTGNSLLRGPDDVVQVIYERLTSTGQISPLSSSTSPASSPNAPTSTGAVTAAAARTSGRFPCAEPHTLAFSIGGKLFPVDPRDFATQVMPGNIDVCGANVVGTDPPEVGGYLFSWSLGAPFLKSVLSAYHFGNLTYPSRDPPRMGFLSTVPEDADRLLQTAVRSAAGLQNFPMVTAPAPTGTGRLVSGGIVGHQSTAAPGRVSSAPRSMKTSAASWMMSVAAALTLFMV